MAVGLLITRACHFLLVRDADELPTMRCLRETPRGKFIPNEHMLALMR